MLPTSRARSNTFPVPYPQYVVHPTVLSVLYSLSLYPTLPINTLSPPYTLHPKLHPWFHPCAVSPFPNLSPLHTLSPLADRNKSLLIEIRNHYPFISALGPGEGIEGFFLSFGMGNTTKGRKNSE